MYILCICRQPHKVGVIVSEYDTDGEIVKEKVMVKVIEKVIVKVIVKVTMYNNHVRYD